MVKTNVPQTMLSFECNNPLWDALLTHTTLVTLVEVVLEARELFLPWTAPLWA